MMVNWEFMDNQTPASATAVVDDLRAGKEVRSTRGPRICTWREAERVLAGFPDDLADEGPSAGHASLVGLGIARERGWTAPDADAEGDGPGVAEDSQRPVAGAEESDDSMDTAASVEAESPTDTTAAEKGEAT
jgi:NADH-quinone oxidoreductase subunit E